MLERTLDVPTWYSDWKVLVADSALVRFLRAHMLNAVILVPEPLQPSPRRLQYSEWRFAQERNS